MPPHRTAAHRDAYNSLPMGRRKRIALIAHDFVLSSPLMDVEYQRMVFDHSPRAVTALS